MLLEKIDFNQLVQSYGNLKSSSIEELSSFSSNDIYKCRLHFWLRALKPGFPSDLDRLKDIYVIDLKTPDIIDLDAKQIAPFISYNKRPNGKIFQFFIGEIFDSKKDESIFGSNVSMIFLAHRFCVLNQELFDQPEYIAKHVTRLFIKNRSDFGIFEMFSNLDGFENSNFQKAKG